MESLESHTDLPGRLRAVGRGRSDQQDFELMAVEFESAANGYFGEPQTCDVKRFVGTWARARKKLCSITGEALV